MGSHGVKSHHEMEHKGRQRSAGGGMWVVKPAARSKVLPRSATIRSCVRHKRTQTRGTARARRGHYCNTPREVATSYPLASVASERNLTS